MWPANGQGTERKGMMDKRMKRWGVVLLAVCLLLLVFAGALTAIVDPYFHYHKPLAGLAYPLDNERYQNDGIVKHFDYDALITGTSMTENFRASELDELFGVNTVKVSLAGASYKEVNGLVETALEANPDIRMVVRSVDGLWLAQDKDYMAYVGFPTYLYDDNIINDVNYVLNRSILNDTVRVIKNTLGGGETTSFDDYENWQDRLQFGEEAIGYVPEKKLEGSVPISQENYEAIEANLSQNFIALAKSYPDTQFYLFFPPYSICWWDAQYRKGALEWQLLAEKYAIELLLECENVHLFSFSTEFEMICDLDNYADDSHYSEEINSRILEWMRDGTHELTRENYMDYWEEEYDFYMNYDYEGRFPYPETQETGSAVGED